MLYALAPNSHIQYTQPQQHQLSSCVVVGRCLLFSETSGSGFGSWIDHQYSTVNTTTTRSRRGQWYYRLGKKKLRAGGSSFWQDLSRPVSVDMEPINDSEQLDQILLNAQQLSQPIIIDWMASWCRKCIYLKPKLEKLAAEFDSKTKFYYVDVNKVPQALVKRGNISKMPTIQLWKDGEKQAEIIGGHKAWLVVDEVREMIQKYV